jgi:hypothetical protein
MSLALDGTNGITFNNSSTQAQSAGLGTSATAQTWVVYVAAGTGSSRASGTTYTNSTGYPIQVLISGSLSGGTCSVNGTIISYNNGVNIFPHSFIVPNGATYSTTLTPYYWSELR